MPPLSKPPQKTFHFQAYQIWTTDKGAVLYLTLATDRQLQTRPPPSRLEIKLLTLDCQFKHFQGKFPNGH